jgi:plastocyanin
MFAKRFVRNPLRLALGTLAVVALVVALAACGSSGSKSSGTSPSTKAPTTTSTGAASSASGDTVNLKLIAYKPAELTVTAGTTVTWHQMDPGFHTVTSGTVSQDGGGVSMHPDGKFDSGQLATGTSFSFKFDTPGTYTYFCQIHPATMHGQVTVT